MLKKTLELEEVEREFELDLQTAKAQAREKAFSEIEEKEKKKGVERWPNRIFLKAFRNRNLLWQTADRRPPLLTSENTSVLP